MTTAKRNTKATKLCDHCGAAYHPFAGRVTAQRFCSRACWEAAGRGAGRKRKPREARVCTQCGKAFIVPRGAEDQTTCSRACAGKLRRVADGVIKTRRHIHLPGHPLADSECSVAEHRAVLYAKVGPGAHPCHWCGKSLEWLYWHQPTSIVADHVDGNWRNNAPDNLVVSCAACNSQRAWVIKDEEEFIELPTTGLDGKPHRARVKSIPCVSCGKTFKARLNRAGSPRSLCCGSSCAALHRFACERGEAVKHVPVCAEPKKKQARSRTPRVCVQCGKDFMARADAVKYGRGTVCSTSCAAKYGYQSRQKAGET